MRWVWRPNILTWNAFVNIHSLLYRSALQNKTLNKKLRLDRPQPIIQSLREITGKKKK